MNVLSNITPINATGEKIFSIVTNCNNFEKIAASIVQNWHSEETFCSFTLQGIVNVTLRIKEITNYSKIVYQIENNHQIPATITLSLEENQNLNNLQIAAAMEVPMLLSGMVKKPLENFVAVLAEGIKKEAEK
ncbi:MAG: hypothetical protein LBU51_02805 [Bacteroidales bacterium]|jgi:hypothetical protein|nr:hypothetical protein [Bacteroidales bacterium]